MVRHGPGGPPELASMPDTRTRTDVSGGTMPAAPIIAPRPTCWRCSWVIMAGQRWRLKLCHGGCPDHGSDSGILRQPWDYLAWRSAAILSRP